MSDELDRLWALHELDEQAAAVHARRKLRPAERAELERRVAAERAALESQRTRVTEAQKRRRELEKDIETLSAEERKFQGQLAAVKKNEEYQALLHEIENVRKRRSEIETEVLTRMEEEDALAAARPALEKALATAERERGERVARLDADDSADAGRLAELDASRAKHIGGLPAATRTRYERVHGLREGRAVVSVAKGSCGGCFRSLPPQMMQEARRRDRVLVCEGCGRMLVWPPGDA
jgi:predicted  nucleic acid-binding Zn-ribbon protein